MIVAIDYDDTISLNHNLWQEVINTFNSFGAKVYVVTYRESTRFQDMKIPEGVIDTVFTNAQAKREYCEEMGIDIDIWIDDSPESVIFGYSDLVKHMKIR